MDTTFSNGTVIQADWLNDVNNAVYHPVNSSTVNCTLEPYNADNTGVLDATSAIQAALDSGKKDVYLPAGVYKITSTLTIPNYTTLRGDGYEVNSGGGATRIIKSGTFTGIIVNVASQLLNLSIEGDTGNGGDGVQILGGRSFVQNVVSNGHGQDGFHIGAYSTDPYASVNTNLWRAVNIIARSNGRHGCLVQHEASGALPNNNAGVLVGLDAGYNGGDGLKVSETVDNHFYNITCQVNTGYGINVVYLAKGNFFTAPYLEANVAGDLILDTGADRNYVLGVRGGTANDGYVINGADNIVWGRYGSVNPIPLHLTPEAFKDLQLLETTTSGRWRFKKEPTSRYLSMTLTGTSATSDVLITNDGGGSAGLRFGTAATDGALRGIVKSMSTTVTQTVAASSTADYTVTLAGFDPSYVVQAVATHAINAGLTWVMLWNGTNLILRFRNHTASAINVSGTFNFVAQKIV